MKSAD